jgi:hypothetical protein
METKSDGINFIDWVEKLLTHARGSGYYLNSGDRAIFQFYKDDYSAEDCWQEIFENMDGYDLDHDEDL